MHLSSEWYNQLEKEINSQYFHDIVTFLEQETNSGKLIYPSKENTFKALNLTKPKNIKVVILGQDPYHGHGQAHGLSFSVNSTQKIPPSLRNIYKEIDDEGITNITDSEGKLRDGNLEGRAIQGVLLLNSVLTVEAGRPASHSKIGWQKFTDAIIKCVSTKTEGVVFLLWGQYAITKKDLIDSKKHLVLTSPHPSPFSAYKGFFGNGHFKKCNNYLLERGVSQINW